MIKIEDIYQAKVKLQGVVLHTPLTRNENLSDQYGANIMLKREDLQAVRSYKIRGAYNKISSLSEDEVKRGVVCASAGNHAQGVAYACRKLNIKATIFMPLTTPKQKVNKVRLFGKDNVEIILKGDTFDESFMHASKYCEEHNQVFIHPFDADEVIAGQGTVGLEVMEDSTHSIDYLFVPIGGGGLAAGICTVFKHLSPQTKIIGVEPEGAASMKTSIENGVITSLDEVDRFVDGTAVKRVGDTTFEICKNCLNNIILVPEGKVCTTILRLYNEDAIVVEPAGALTISALDFYAKEIKGKNVVCIVSGGNNDITRTEEIKERSLLYEGLKHYFLVNMSQRPGALKEFVNDVLRDDDITYFQYTKKNNRESGPAVVGIELNNRDDLGALEERLHSHKIKFQHLNNHNDLFTHLIS